MASNSGSDPKQLALRLLSRREHTSAQLEKKLLRRHSREAVGRVLDELAEAGLLDDENAAFGRAQVCRRRRRWGDRRIRLDLRSLGIDAKIVDRVLARINQEYPQEECLRDLIEVWTQKAGPPRTAAEARNLFNRCARRGFAPELIREALQPALREVDWNR